MKNQLTTIAALPSGAGQAAHLEPEVGKARAPEPWWNGVGPVTLLGFDLAAGEHDMAALTTYTRKYLDPKTGAVLREETHPQKFVTVTIEGSIDAKTRAQLAGSMRTFRFRDWKGE